MKKILSIFLSISILSVAFFGCYLNTYAADDSDFYKYLQVGEVSEHDKGIYDSVYGSDGWYTDSDGYLWIDKSNNAYNSTSSKVMMSMVPYMGVSAAYTSIASAVNKLYRANKLFDWVNEHKSDMNLKNGILSIGKNAMSAWSDVFRNNCYDMGDYIIITNNMSVADMDALVYKKSSKLSDSKFKDFYKNYNDFKSFSTTYFLNDPTSSSLDLQAIKMDSFSFAVADSFTNSSSRLYFYDMSLNKNTFSDLKFIWTSSDGRHGLVNGHNSNYAAIYLDFTNSIMYHGNPLKVFKSLGAAMSYYHIYSSSSVPGIYFYNNYSPTNINVNLSTVKNTDYEQVFNNTYNTVNEEKNTYITNNSSISEEELQKIIEKALDKYISDTGNSGDNSGDNTSGNTGGNTGDNTGGNTGGSSTDLSGIEKLLKSMEHFLDLIEQHTGWTDTRLELTNSVLSNMQTVINTIGETLTGQQDILKEIRDLLDADSGKSIFDYLGDILDDTIGELLGSLLKDLVDFFIGDGGIVEAVTSPASALASTAQSKFPTSIPWDIIAIIKIMSAEPQAPKIEIPFKMDRLGINYTITIDLEKADKVAELSRNMLTVTFLLFLTIQTRKLYGAMSKN